MTPTGYTGQLRQPDVRNLWPEPLDGTDGAHVKDGLENRLHGEVCAGQISLAQAQAQIVHWDTAPSAPPAIAAPAVTTTTTSAPATTRSTLPVTPGGDPAGSTAQCTDGTYSSSAHRSGTCSHHGGVARWINGGPAS